MRFKEYMNESVDVDTSQIEINGNKYEFEFDGLKYKVMFTKHSLYSIPVSGVCILFEGIKGVNPTGASGNKASQVYGIMLSAVIAYIEKYKPNALIFSGATSGMNLIYRRFAERYAKDEPGKSPDTIYIRMNESEWIRKDVYENLSDRDKRKASEEIESWKEYEPEYIENARNFARRLRENRIKFNNYIGGFIHTFGEGWFIIIGLNEYGLEVYDYYLYRVNIDNKELENAKLFLPSQINLVPKEIIAKFAKNISQYRVSARNLPPGSAERIIAAAGEQ